MPQIGARGIGRLVDAIGTRERRAWNPEPAAGACRGAAEARLLLDDEHIEATVTRGDRGGHAGTARSGHEHIAVVNLAGVVGDRPHRGPHFFKSGHFDSEIGRKASSPFTVLTISR